MHNEYVYILRSGSYFKIGRTVDFGKRIAQLKIQLPFAVELFKAINTHDSAKLEGYLHRLYAKRRANGEWFLLNDYDIVVLLLFPASVDCSSFVYPDDVRNLAKDSFVRILENARTEALIQQQIHAESTMIFNDIPDYFGDILVADLLAAECPYDPDPLDMDWVIAYDPEDEA